MAYVLHWISGSPNSWRVMLAMELMGLSYASRRLDPGKREHKSTTHLALNPWGKVPVLQASRSASCWPPTLRRICTTGRQVTSAAEICSPAR